MIKKNGFRTEEDKTSSCISSEGRISGWFDCWPMKSMGENQEKGGIEISSLMRLIVWSRGRPGRLAIRKENRFYIRYGMEKDLTSISSVGEKESFLVDCREALLGLKLKGLARRQNSFLSGHKQAQKNRIIAQKQGNELTIYEYQRPFPTPSLFGVIVRSTTTSQADLEAHSWMHTSFLAYWILKSTGTVPPLTLTVLPANITSSSSKIGLKRKDIRFIS